VEHSWNDNDRGKPKHLEKTSPHATLPTMNPTWTTLGSDPSYCGYAAFIRGQSISRYAGDTKHDEGQVSSGF